MKHRQPGFLLTVEGCDGAGKTTAIQYIGQWLQEQAIAYSHTREPGGTPMAEAIRQVLLADQQESVAATTELLLLFAARCQNLNQIIKPAIAHGKVVLCDRFTDATYAYQGGGRGIDRQHIARLETLVQGDCRPNLTILLDVAPAIGLARRVQAGRMDRIEQEDIAFFQRVRAVYRQQAQQQPERYVVVDATQPIAQVQRQLSRILDQRLQSYR